MKLLESNGVSQSAFSGIATNYLNSEFQNGYLKHILNECNIIKVSANTITIDTGFIFVEGLRLYFDELYTITIPNFPASTLLYHLIVRIDVSPTGENKAEIIYRPVEALRRDDVVKTNSGIYELEIATFTLSSEGITAFEKEIKPISLTNEHLEDLKKDLEDLEIEFDSIKQTIITANEDADKALTMVNNFSIGSVTSGDSPSANITTDEEKQTITLDLVLQKGATGSRGPTGPTGPKGDSAYEAEIEIDLGITDSPIFIDSFTNDEILNLVKTALENSGPYSVLGIYLVKFIAHYAVSIGDDTIQVGAFMGEVFLGSQYTEFRVQIDDYLYVYQYGMTSIENSYYIKIHPNKNGVVQFSQNLYEESVNELDLYSGVANRLSYSISNNSLRLYGATYDYATYTIDLSHLKGQEVTLGIDEVNVVSGTPYVVFYADADIFQEVLSSGYTKTFTIPSTANTIELSFYSNRGSTDGDVTLTNIMLNVGKTLLQYHSYNSSSHITNAQADLLKSEYEKGLNEFDISVGYNTVARCSVNTSNNQITIVNNGNWTECWFNRTKLKPNTLYTLNMYVQNDEGTNFKVNVFKTNSSDTLVSGHVSSSTGYYKVNFTTDDSGLCKLTFYPNYSGTSKTNTIIIEGIMINEGSEALPYQEYNGKIVRDIDITPVLLWKNANDLTQFVGQNVTLSQSLSNFKRFRVYYRRYASTNNAIEYKDCVVQEPSSSALFRLFNGTYDGSSSTGYNSIRNFSINSYTIINFEGGISVGTTNDVGTADDSVCIPVKIEGLYY